MSFMFNAPTSLAKLWATSFKSYWKVFAAVIVLMVVTNFLLPLVLFGVTKISVNKIVVASASLVILLILLYCAIGILLRANAALQGKVLNFSDMLQAIKSRYFPALLVALILFVLLGILGSLTISIFTQGAAINMSPYAIGAIQAVITMLDVILLVFIIFALPIVVIDNIGPFAAYKSSFVLAKHYWWRTFFGLLLIVLLYVVAYFLGATLIGYVIKVANINVTSLSTIYSVQLLLDIIAIFIKTWGLTFLLLLLNDLKMRQRNAISK